MGFYFRFLGSLAFGLFGLGMVLKIAMDHLFNDWDAFGAARAWFESLFKEKSALRYERTEDVLMAAEKNKFQELSTRLTEKRRELQKINEVEQRLNSPRAAAATSYQDWAQN